MTGECEIDCLVSALCPSQNTFTLFSFFHRDLQIESLKRDLELLRAELERVKSEVRGRYD